MSNSNLKLASKDGAGEDSDIFNPETYSTIGADPGLDVEVKIVCQILEVKSKIKVCMYTLSNTSHVCSDWSCLVSVKKKIQVLSNRQIHGRLDHRKGHTHTND